MIEGVDEWEGRSAVEGSSVIKGGRDAHRRLIDIGDTKVDFPHDEMMNLTSEDDF